MQKNNTIAKINECVNVLGFDIEVQGPEEEQYKMALIWWAKLANLVDCAEEIIIFNPLNRSIPAKFQGIYKYFSPFQDQVIMGLVHDGLHLIEFQQARGVKNQDLIDFII